MSKESHELHESSDRRTKMFVVIYYLHTLYHLKDERLIIIEVFDDFK